MPEESTPLFLTVAERIEDGILDGTYPAGDLVPSTTDLSRLLRINPATAGKGLKLLVDADVLVPRRGIGNVVAEDAARLLRDRRRRTFPGTYLAPLVREARRLGITTTDITRMITEEETR